MIDMNAIWQRWEAVGSTLDERGRRLFAAVGRKWYRLRIFQCKPLNYKWDKTF
jgi:hypothetical protein